MAKADRHDQARGTAAAPDAFAHRPARPAPKPAAAAAGERSSSGAGRRAQGAGRRAQGAGRRAQGAGRRAQGGSVPAPADAGGHAGGSLGQAGRGGHDEGQPRPGWACILLPAAGLGLLQQAQEAPALLSQRQALASAGSRIPSRQEATRSRAPGRRALRLDHRGGRRSDRQRRRWPGQPGDRHRRRGHRLADLGRSREIGPASPVAPETCASRSRAIPVSISPWLACLVCSASAVE
jgi:hypothetical protein